MPAESMGNAYSRFGRDLRRIREDRKVSVAELHQATQLSRRQIEALESGALFESETMNAVYLRAIVRAYSEAIGVSPDAVLDHLDRALDGTYENELAVDLLGVPPSVAEEVSSEGDVEESEPEGEGDTSGESEEASVVGDEDEAGASTSDDAEEVAEDGNESLRDGGSVPEWLHDDAEDETAQKNVPETRATSEGTTQPPDSTSQARSGRESGTVDGWDFARLWRQRRSEIVVAGTALLIIVGVVVILMVFTGESSGDSADMDSPTAGVNDPKTEALAPSDSAEGKAELRSPANIVLGDTLYMTIVAEGVVQRMRVRQDDDLRRPYWIERGDARVFPFTNRIIIEDRLDSVRVYFERYPYPTSRRDAEGRIFIDRETAQSIADTLRGEPVALPLEPDTVKIRSPSPENGVE